MASVVYTLLSTQLDAEVFNKIKDAFDDVGLTDQMNKWKDAFDGRRMPPQMTHTSIKFKIDNLENELIKLRGMLFNCGIDREERALADFTVGENSKGRSVLRPKTRLAKIMLKNTFDEDFRLNSIPSSQYEQLAAENHKLREKIDELEAMVDRAQDWANRTNIENRELETANSNLQKELNSYEQSDVGLRNENKLLKAMLHNDGNYIENLEKIVEGLAKRCGFETSYESIEYDDDLPKHPFEISFGIDRFDDFIQYTRWKKDLTADGDVEANPGPVHLLIFLFSVVAAAPHTHPIINRQNVGPLISSTLFITPKEPTLALSNDFSLVRSDHVDEFPGIIQIFHDHIEYYFDPSNPAFQFVQDFYFKVDGDFIYIKLEGFKRAKKYTTCKGHNPVKLFPNFHNDFEYFADADETVPAASITGVTECRNVKLYIKFKIDHNSKVLHFTHHLIRLDTAKGISIMKQISRDEL